MQAAPQAEPFTIVQVASLGTIGDNIYRVHEPCAALARLPGVAVFEVHAQSRYWTAAALSADVLVLTMTLDVEVHRLIHQRRQLGRLTICEVNDYLPDVQASNPAHRTWADPRGIYLFEQLIARCDAVQVSSAALGEQVAHLARHIAVFDNHLAELPAPAVKPFRLHHSASPLVIGWGGSLGHLQDMQHIAPALVAWLKHQNDVRLEIMADASIAALFSGLSPQQFQHRPAGTLAQYLAWLRTVDIGIAPLLPTLYNRCRSDVKFLEFAAHGAVPVVQRLEPYCATVQDGVTGFLFDTPAHLLTLLDTLVADPALRQQVSAAALQFVRAERGLALHIPKRLAFYREQQARVNTAYSATHSASHSPPLPVISEALAKAASTPLLSLPGWQSHSLGLAANHHRLDVHTAPEQHSAAGIDAMQRGDWASACAAFAEAVRLDASDAHSLSFLGDCLLRQNRLPLARQALERAIALDPLLSRPQRALARLHHMLARHHSDQAAQLNPLPSWERAGTARQTRQTL